MASNPARPEKKIAQQVGYKDSWWPGAESNQGLGCLTLALDYLFKRHHKPIVYVANTVVVDTAWNGS